MKASRTPIHWVWNRQFKSMTQTGTSPAAKSAIRSPGRRRCQRGPRPHPPSASTPRKCWSGCVRPKARRLPPPLKVPPVPKSFMPRRDHIMTLAPSSADIEAATALEPSDLISFDTLLTDEEIALRDRVRTYVREEIKPNIATWYEEARFPLEIVPDLAKLGLLGM